MTDDLVSVLWTQSWVEAELTKGRLEAEGIPVHLEGVADGPYPTGPNELLVPSAFEADARRIIGAIGGGSFALPDDDDADDPPATPGEG